MFSAVKVRGKSTKGTVKREYQGPKNLCVERRNKNNGGLKTRGLNRWGDL